MKLIKLVLIVSSLMLLEATVFGYSIQTSNKSQIDNKNVEMLQKMSNGISAISKDVHKGIVFISIYKMVRGIPFGMIDPFDFLFGPGFRRGMPDGSPGKRGAPRQKGERRRGGLGSGFFIDLKKGYILTNNHVVQDADEIQLKLANGQTYEGKIVGRDKNTDVAVIQVKDKKFNRTGLKALKLGDSDKANVGDFVIALGAPFGLEASISFGVISAVGRKDLDIAKLENFIQTDAAINPGNSGGPLIDMNANVIGINTAIASRSGGYNGIGFTIPSNFAKNVAEQLINEGKVERGYLGVWLQPIDNELSRGLNLPKNVSGALVARISNGSPADKGGLEPGDVITAINGKKTGTSSEVVNMIGLRKPGSKIEMTVYRSGKKRSHTVKVGSHPDNKQQLPHLLTKKSKAKQGPYGMLLSKVSPFLREKYGSESKKGVVVINVIPDSSADRAGIRDGDIILEVNSQKVSSPKSFKKTSTSGKSRILVRIERSGQYFFVTLHNK